MSLFKLTQITKAERLFMLYTSQALVQYKMLVFDAFNGTFVLTRLNSTLA